jgi:uncharacterized membrane protein YfcA
MISYLLIKQSEVKHLDTEEDLTSGNIKFTLERCLFLSSIGLCIGFGGILFGLTGGAIINPLLIYIGFDALVTFN